MRICPLRYALYFTPPADDPLTQTAAAWLGRDAFHGRDLPIGKTGTFPTEVFHGLTADPRRYGFHATIKAPFSLANDRSEADLVEAFDRFCSAQPAFDIPSVVVDQLGPFFAIVPADTHKPLQDFAAAAVEAFEPFRAPLSDADVARRKPERLSEAQRDNLMRWGYPYVMDEFRFHMTLSGPVETHLAPAMKALATECFSSFTQRPIRISGLALFVEPERCAPFTVHTWKPLTGTENL